MGIIPLCAALMSEQFKYKAEGRGIKKGFVLRVMKCAKREQAFYLCELPSISSPSQPEPLKAPSLSQLSAGLSVKVVACPQGHLTHTFLACDADSMCWASSSSKSDCLAPVTPLPPMFECANGLEAVPYTLVCDYRSDCRDSSDERFCAYPPCSGITSLPCGNTGQVVLSVCRSVCLSLSRVLRFLRPVHLCLPPLFYLCALLPFPSLSFSLPLSGLKAPTN